MTLYDIHVDRIALTAHRGVRVCVSVSVCVSVLVCIGVCICHVLFHVNCNIGIFWEYCMDGCV